METVKVSNNSKKNPEVEAATGSKASRPRRGRPSGAKRIPLTLEERRARNAQYERERREDFTAAQAELAEAAGCDPNTSMPHLMAFVVNKLTNAKEAQNLEEYKKTNENLEVQIANCFEQLGPNFILSDGEDDEPNSRKRKLSEETFGEDERLRPAPSPLLPLDTMSEHDIALLFLTPPSPLLRLEAVSEDDISLSFMTPPSESPPVQLESKDAAELFSQDDLRQIYGALNSVDQLG
ncbi:unnamed protein product [Spodoptera exigua]|nr:unnamed protein product [Spodoptera exigua]